jgi:CMP-2-keto-3-deoxyoctulosonic acid synthetase
MKPYQFEVHPVRCIGNGFRIKDVTVNIQGSLPAVAWKWITPLGLELHKDQSKIASHTSGGHQTLRTFVNILMAQ